MGDIVGESGEDMMRTDEPAGFENWNLWNQSNIMGDEFIRLFETGTKLVVKDGRSFTGEAVLELSCGRAWTFVSGNSIGRLYTSHHPQTTWRYFGDSPRPALGELPDGWPGAQCRVSGDNWGREIYWDNGEWLCDSPGEAQVAGWGAMITSIRPLPDNQAGIDTIEHPEAAPEIGSVEWKARQFDLLLWGLNNQPVDPEEASAPVRYLIQAAQATREDVWSLLIKACVVVQGGESNV